MTPAQGGRSRLRLGEWFALSIGLLVLVAIAGLVAGLLALSRLADARGDAVDRIDPALTAALRLQAALLNEETGVRGYALTRDETFLEPYRRGRTEERAAGAVLAPLLRRVDPGVVRDAGAVRHAADRWRRSFAEPVIADVRGGRSTFTAADQARGKASFDRVRATLATLSASLQRERRRARAELRESARLVTVIFVAFGVLLLVTVLVSGGVLRAVAVVPLGRLAERVREVARGDFGRRVEAGGAREVVTLGDDVDAMRRRILEELDALAAARDDLERSNAELEQFAYVASHDLQEPLRKVASFTQMLQRRYEGQLDERADQYIGFAVDGARRMQDLINDLLRFSRVGRVTEDFTDVDTAELVRRAQSTLQERIEETGGRIEVDGELPVVRGEATLLALVFQNLIGNGLKFRGDDPPVVRVSALRRPAEGGGEEWCFSVSDNGIGIDAEYADRIFIIFQRLHPRTSYEGTGIGLAMCRKVVEYHGGEIWLDTAPGRGATFHFTLPSISEEVPAA
jgi:signal transduction histidine kinase